MFTSYSVLTQEEVGEIKRKPSLKQDQKSTKVLICFFQLILKMNNQFNLFFTSNFKIRFDLSKIHNLIFISNIQPSEEIKNMPSLKQDSKILGLLMFYLLKFNNECIYRFCKFKIFINKFTQMCNIVFLKCNNILIFN